jgi:DNA-binding response OmpR family regulator
MDGDAVFIQAVGECLHSRGYDVIPIGDPAALIGELISAQHRLVLLGIDFPGIDGLELLREIKRNDGSTQVIVLTGTFAMASVIQSFRDGAEACFLKPMATIDPLVEAVEDAFRKTERWWECLGDLAKRTHARAAALSGESTEARSQGSTSLGKDAQKCSVENRRRWTRYRAEAKEITVVADGGRQEAVVVDESFGGISLLMDNPTHVLSDGEITLVYQGVAMQGIVRHVRPEEDGGCRVGIEWLRSSRGTDRSPRTVTRQGETLFVSFCGLRLADRVVRNLVTHGVCVRLPNGSEHNAKEDVLYPVTRTQRQRELERLGPEVTMLLGIYELGKQESKESAIQAILDLEYGDSWK